MNYCYTFEGQLLMYNMLQDLFKMLLESRVKYGENISLEKFSSPTRDNVNLKDEKQSL